MNIKTVCERNMCTGCGACVEICKKGSISIVDNLDSMNAVINLDQCVDCGVCFKVCPNKTTLNCEISYHGIKDGRLRKVKGKKFVWWICNSFIQSIR